jgi:predicted transcriptional regulator
VLGFKEVTQELDELTEIQRNVSRNIRAIMLRKRLEVKDLADMTGIPTSTVYKITYGSWTSPENFQAVLDALKLSPGDVFGPPIAWDKPTLLEAAKVILEHAEKAEKMPDVSRIDPVLLRRLATLDDLKLKVVEAKIRGTLDGLATVDQNAKPRKSLKGG